MKYCSYNVGMVVDISGSYNDENMYITIGKAPHDVSSYIKLIYSNKTLLIDKNYNEIRIEDIQVGDFVVAFHSNAMTKSIPPQTTAYIIKLLK